MVDKASLSRGAFLLCLSHTGNVTIAAEFAGVNRAQILAEMAKEEGFKTAVAEGILDIWLPQWRDYSVKRQAALTSLAYNLGGPRLSQFVKLKAALQKQDFTTAAQEALQSKWAGQVGARAQEIAALIKGCD